MDCLRLFASFSVAAYKQLQRPAPSLPPECWSRIFSHLSDGDNSGPEGGSWALLKCAVVSKTWSDFSRPYLYRKLVILSVQSGEQLLEVLERRGLFSSVRQMLLWNMWRRDIDPFEENVNRGAPPKPLDGLTARRLIEAMPKLEVLSLRLLGGFTEGELSEVVVPPCEMIYCLTDAV